MKAIRHHRYGAADTLRADETDRPAPGSGEVLVKVAATSFNPVDATIRAGHLQQVFPVPLPHTPGIDVAGTVAALGDGVTAFAVGDAVYGMLPMTGGAAADYVAAPVTGLAAWQADVAHAEPETLE
ncbi:alcohol dehydrogenase catalytic domain-containing protein [Actinoplanes sp. NPDC024001]|uniref:alcohol dehydrogenase catalytic domain-containing protein n=1 Tax=Actinoplanes sp. NPDC024001 TaxID=3154598 RepID=UPI0033C2337E